MLIFYIKTTSIIHYNDMIMLSFLIILLQPQQQRAVSGIVFFWKTVKNRNKIQQPLLNVNKQHTKKQRKF